MNIIFRFANIISNSANSLGSTFSIYQPIITFGLAQINSILLINLLQKVFHTYKNCYT